MKAVLVFCEGTSDVVFVERSLGALGGYERLQSSIKDLPSPFGADKSLSRGLIATRLAERPFEDFALRASSYQPSPHFESAVQSVVKDRMFLLIRVGGKAQAKATLKLIQHVGALMSEGEFDVTEHGAAFLFDANAEGVGATLEKFRKAYGTYFGGLVNTEHGQWTKTNSIPVGVYIFHKGAQETGTLEDHLEPMVKSAWPDRYANALRFIDDNRKSDDKASRNDATRLKAIITTAGQFRHPGNPLATMIARNGLPDVQFEESAASQALVEFLEATPWNAPPEAADVA